ncbi:hypothetical protein [Streptomyces sp. CAU 1734]|uniref:hypothetical protein n=1 Tax=Streptomyces sp. CAU 1734 TaxID=3140360 RepID=UPI00325FFF42
MLAPSHSASRPGAMPPSRRIRSSLVRTGLRYELLLHRPCAENENERCPEPQELGAPDTPRRAIRALRDSVRARAALLGPRDRYAILEALDDHGEGGLSGDVQAVAALHRGLPVGFAFTSLSGDHLEWAVRPVTFLALVRVRDGGAACPPGRSAETAAFEPRTVRPAVHPARGPRTVRAARSGPASGGHSRAPAL